MDFSKEFVEKLKQKIKNGFEEFIDTIPIGIFVYKDLKIIYANEKIREILGLSQKEDLIGRNVLDFVPKSRRDEVLNGIEEALKQRYTKGKSVIYEVITLSGERKWLEIKAKLIEMEGDTLFVDFVIDRTSEVLAQKKILEREKRFNELFENAYDAIFFEKLDSTIIDVNKAACKMLGYTKEELIGRNAKEIVPFEVLKEQEEALRDSVLKKRKYVVVAENIRKDGSRVPVEVSVSRVDIGGEEEIIVIARDITERKRLEEQLIQSQKMRTVGLLAGGLAHDINNILSAIVGNIEIYERSPDSPEAREKLIKRIKDAVEKGKRIIEEVLIFAKKREYPKKPVDLVSVIKEAIEVSLGSFPENVSLRFNPYIENAIVNGSAPYLIQVFMNLIINAAEAIGDRSGEVILTLREEKGDYLVEVKDTGDGIDEEILDKIFDPFFSTKRGNRGREGTGLGLSVVWSIIHDMNGEISVSSQKGKGTTFTIRIPKLDRPIPDEDKNRKVKEGNGGKKKRVLVVDDEKNIREITRELLEIKGYDVMEAEDGIKASHVIEREKDIDVVILDMVMPKLNGRGVLERMSLLDRPPCVIISTGYMDVKIDTLKESFPFVSDIIYKPYRIESLYEIIERCLGK